MATVCKNCKLYKGDCGHHFVDNSGHIHWDVPKESACDRCGQCDYYEPKPDTVYSLLARLKKCNMTDKDKELIESIILSQNTPDDKIDMDRLFFINNGAVKENRKFFLL